MAEHSIDRFVIQLKSRNPQQAERLKEKFLRLLKGKLGAALEELLDLYDRPAEVQTIPKLRLNIGPLRENEWERQLLKILLQQLGKLLAKEDQGRALPSTEWLALRHFLEKGTLPTWWEGDFEAFLDSLVARSAQRLWTYLEKIDLEAPALRRWAWQLSDTQRWSLLAEKLNPAQLSQLKQSQQKLSPNEASLELLFWQTAFQFASQKQEWTWNAFWQKQLAEQAAVGKSPLLLRAVKQNTLVAADYQSSYTEREVLLYYLEHGALPIWAKVDNRALLIERLERSWEEEEAYWSDWLQRQANRRSRLWRLTRLLPREQIQTILQKLHSKSAFFFVKAMLRDIDYLLPKLPLSISTTRIQTFLLLDLLEYTALRIGQRFLKRQLFDRFIRRLLLQSPTDSAVFLKTLRENWLKAPSKKAQRKQWLSWLRAFEVKRPLKQDLALVSSSSGKKAGIAPELKNLEQATTRGKLDYLRFLLSQGTQPWWAEAWANKGLASILEELLAEQPQALLRAIRSWSQQAPLWNRLIEQFPEAQLSQLLLLQLPEKGGAWLRFGELLERLPETLMELKGQSRRQLKWSVLLLEALRSSEEQSLDVQLEVLLLALAKQTQLPPLRLLQGLEELLKGEERSVFTVLKQLLPQLRQRARLRNWRAGSSKSWKNVLKQLKAWGYTSGMLQMRLVNGQDMAALKSYLQEGLAAESSESAFLQKLRSTLQEKTEAELQQQSVELEREQLQNNLLAAKSEATFEMAFLTEQAKRPSALRAFLRKQAAEPVLLQRLVASEEVTIEAMIELWQLPNANQWLALLSDAARLGWEKQAREQFLQALLAEKEGLQPSNWLRQSLEAEAKAQSRDILPLLLDWRTAWRRKKGYSLMPFYLIELQIQQLSQMISEQENPRMRSILSERLNATKQEQVQLEQEQAELRAVWKRDQSERAVPENLSDRLAEMGRVERDLAEQVEEQSAKQAAEQALYLRKLYADLAPKLRLALAKQKRIEQEIADLRLQDIAPVENQLPALPSLPAAQTDTWSKAAFTQGRLKQFFKALEAWEQLLERRLSAHLQTDQSLTDLAEQLPSLQRNLENLLRFLKEKPERFNQKELQLRSYWKDWQAQLETLSSQVVLLATFDKQLRINALRQMLADLLQVLKEGQKQRAKEADLTEADVFGLAQLEKWMAEQEQLREQLEQIRDWSTLERWEKKCTAVEKRQRVEDALTADIEARWVALNAAFETRRAQLKAILEEKRGQKQVELEAAVENWARRASEWLKEALQRDKRVEKSELRKALEKRSKKEELAGVPVLVQNAGLVLLWPFFSRFFKMLKLLDGKRFVNEAAQLKAIHLLQYLVTAQTETPEYELALNKVLCGWPLAEPVPRAVDLSQEELEIADSLLIGVLQNWSKMKSTTPDGLRGGFIVRDGQLTETDERWQLQVERGTLDILLKTLPWGYNLIALPWMPKMIAVDW